MKAKHIVESVLILRVVSQMISPLFDDMYVVNSETTIGDFMYFFGRDIFEVGLMGALLLLSKDKTLNKWLMFFLGYAVYNMIEPFLADPTDLDPFEYYGFVAGIVFLLLQYVYQRFVHKGSK